jgi:NADH-quinone oxidoreductase subunit N
MTKMNFLAVLPEAILLAAACLILVADLFVPERRRNLSYALSLGALAAVALACWNLLDGPAIQYAFGGMFVTDPMAQVLKLFACLSTAFALIYAQTYARGRAIWRGELFSIHGAANAPRIHFAVAVYVAGRDDDDLRQQPAADLSGAGAAVAGAVRAGRPEA